jgi:AraC-like DNA-binding protein
VSATSRVELRDLDAARAEGSRVYYPHRIEVLGAGGGGFAMRLSSVRVGPLLVGSLHYDVPVRIETTAALETAYEVNVPCGGELESWTADRHVVAGPGTAIVTPPTSSSVLRGFGPGRGVFGLKIDRGALEAQYRSLFGPDRDLPGEWPATVALDRGAGRQWWAVVEGLRAAATVPGPLDHPRVTRPLAETVLSGLLLAWVGEPAAAAPRPAAVRAAVEFVHAHARDPLTIAEIAAAGCCSVRALQEGFRRHVGRSPIGYLREVRLAGAHAELLAADPAHTTVNDVSWSWGFSNPGRFAAGYRAAYGHSPSHTLHRA